MSYIDNKKYRYRNLTGSAAIEITEDFDYFDNKFNYLSLANIHDTDAVNVDLYSTYTAESVNLAEWEAKGHVNNDYTEPTSQTETYYYMKNVTIPVGVSLQLSNTDFHLDSSMRIYIKLSVSSSTVDLSIIGPIGKNVGNIEYPKKYTIPSVIPTDRAYDDLAAARDIKAELDT